MEILNQRSPITFVEGESEISAGIPSLVLATSGGHRVSSYFELLQKVAALSYHNGQYKLLFRGQREDHKLNSRGGAGVHSSLYPSILRASEGKRETALDGRFARLLEAESALKKKLMIQDVHKHQVVRWALLQHYEVCETPLLDVTDSLQIALSFALRSGCNEAFLFIVAFPHLTGPVSVAHDAGTQVLNLMQICPPEALRPHFQSGLLVGDYSAFQSRTENLGRCGTLANNFSCRLIAKLRLTNCSTWSSEGFSPTPDTILFPNDRDSWFPVLNEIRRSL